MLLNATKYLAVRYSFYYKDLLFFFEQTNFQGFVA